MVQRRAFAHVWHREYAWKPSDFELYLSSVNHVPRVHKCDLYMYFKVDVKSKQTLEHNSWSPVSYVLTTNKQYIYYSILIFC